MRLGKLVVGSVGFTDAATNDPTSEPDWRRYWNFPGEMPADMKAWGVASEFRAGTRGGAAPLCSVR